MAVLLDRSLPPVPRECYAQYVGSLDSIVGVGLIEVTTSKQEQSIGILCLEVEELLHHGCYGFFWHVRVFVLLPAKIRNIILMKE